MWNLHSHTSRHFKEACRKQEGGGERSIVKPDAKAWLGSRRDRLNKWGTSTPTGPSKKERTAYRGSCYALKEGRKLEWSRVACYE